MSKSSDSNFLRFEYHQIQIPSDSKPSDSNADLERDIPMTDNVTPMHILKRSKLTRFYLFFSTFFCLYIFFFCFFVCLLLFFDVVLQE